MFTGREIFEALTAERKWGDLQDSTRAAFDACAVKINGQLDTRNMLQKKVLMHLVIGFRAEIQHMSCDEEEIGGLSDYERMALTRELSAMDGEEWDGTASDKFSLSSLCELALSWVGSANG